MYVTRPLSLYRNSSEPPVPVPEPALEGPNTGVLVIEDDASEKTRFFGLMKDKSVKSAPFPQNKIMELRYSSGVGNNQHTDLLYALLIPALNSNSNQYYFIKSRGRTKGLAYASSSEDDDTSGCCCFSIPDRQPQLFDPTNPYQQFQISNYIYWGKPHGFVSKSMAPDGFPPRFLRHQGWRAYTKTLHHDFDRPTPALGLDAALRARLPPDLDSSSPPVVVGKWYCPFVFVRDGPEVDTQMRHSPYYEMTLQQSWEEIFECRRNENYNKSNGVVTVDVCVKRQAVSVRGVAAERVVVADGVTWFDGSDFGLSVAIVERMKWEEERGGFEWVGEEGEKEVKVKRREEFEGDQWKRFGCYVLIERFVLKRMDGTLVLTWEFRHTHQIRTKWE